MSDVGCDTVAGRMMTFIQYLIQTRRIRSINAFECRCGLSKTFIKAMRKNGSTGLNTRSVQRIQEIFPELNANWLISGKDTMILTDVATVRYYRDLYQVTDQQLELIKAINRSLEAELVEVRAKLRRYEAAIKTKEVD